MDIKFENGELVIRIKPADNPALSSTGRSHLLFTTRGYEAIPGRPGEALTLNYIRKVK